MIPSRPISERVWQIGIFLLGCLILASVSRAPQPGFPSSWLFTQVEPTSLNPAISPISGWWARGMDGWPIATLTARVTALNLLLGALLLVLAFKVIVRIDRHPDHPGSLWTARLLTLYLACSPGFWWAVSRSGPAPTGWVLIAFTVWLIARTIDSPSRCRMAFVALNAGIATVELPAAAAFLPLFGGLLLAAQPPTFSFRIWLLWVALYMAIGLAAGCVLLLIYALPAFLDDPMLTWSSALLSVARAWKAHAADRFPAVGWLTVGLIPTGAILLASLGRSRIKRHMRLTIRLFQWTLMALLLLALYIPEHIWHPFQPRNGTLILPWVLLAMAFGTAHARLRRHAPHWVNVLLVLLILGAAALRYPRISARPAAAFTEIWDAMLSDIRDGDWLVSDGHFDAPLQLHARERGIQTLFVHPALSGHAPYRDWLTRHMPTRHQRSLSSVSLRALLLDQIKRTDTTQRIVFLAHPELIVSSGLPLRTHAARYAAWSQDVTATSSLKQQVETLHDLSRRRDAIGDLAWTLRRYLSKLENNRGVVAEHEALPLQAETAYHLALQLNPDNLSAAINVAMLEHGALSDEEWSHRLRALCAPDLLAQLAARYGFIFSRRALYWITHLCGLQRELDLPEEIVGTIATAYLRESPQQALAAARQAAQTHPNSRTAWMLLGVLAYETGDEEWLARALDRMERTDQRWAPLVLVLGHRAMQEHDFETAARLLAEAHALWPLHTRILEVLIQLHLHLKDEPSLEQTVTHLLAFDPWNPWGNFALGIRYYRAEEWEAAEMAFRRAVSLRAFPIGYNNLAWILFRQGRLDDALFYARRAIETDPHSYAHWNTLAAILLEQGNWSGAADAIHRSRSLYPDAPATAELEAEWRARAPP